MESNRPDRRAFLQQSLAMAGVALTAGNAFAQDQPARSGEGAALLTRMAWLNPPASWSKSGDKLVAHSAPKSDFWREPPGDFRDTGHFCHLPVGGNFAFQARFNGKYNGQYDHAGLMVRVDAENWMKCGSEFYDGQRHASVVFTRGFSDWSTMADLSQSAPVWWRLVRKQNWIETLCSAEGKTFTSVRQGYFASAANTSVGIMFASPKGAGFTVHFDNLKLEIG